MRDRVRPSLNPIMRNFRFVLGRVLDTTLHFFSSFFTNKSQVLEYRVRDLVYNEKLVILHAFPHDRLEQNVLDVIKAFQRDSWRVCLVSNGKFDISVLSEQIDYVMRRNKGFDFGGYRDSLRLYKLSNAERVLLLNDSMFWFPEKLLKLANEKIENLEESVWALTSSSQVSPHLQSYFYLFSGRNSLVADALEAVPNFPIKRMVVSGGEIALSQKLRECEVRLHAFFEYEELVRMAMLSEETVVPSEVVARLKKGIVLNPTQHLWQLLEKLSFPGVKKSLVFKNPARLTEIPTIPIMD